MSVIQCFSLFLPRDKLTPKTDAPDGIEQGCFVMKLKYTITLLATLVVSMLTTTASYAQIWEALFGVAQGYLEKSIDNSNYSSQGKDDFKTIVNFLSDEVNANQKAKNATKDAYEGNYTGAIIQGVQTIMNATGNHQYDTYLNSANAVNKANREYNQNVSSGMDRQEALEKRNEVMGYSIAESVIELQDKIARERIEKARQQRELERQSWESSDNYTPHSYSDYGETNNSNDETTTKATVSNSNEFVGALVAHVNTAAVLDAMPDKVRAEKELERFYGGLQNQLQTMAKEYQMKMQNYESNEATMSNIEKRSKQQEIVDLQTRIQQFQTSAESEFEAKRVELLKPILNRIQNAINAVSNENDLTYIIDISTGAAVFLGEDSIDITYMVMKKLGI